MTDKMIESVLNRNAIAFTRFHRTKKHDPCCGPATFFESTDKKLRLVLKKRRQPWKLDAVWAKSRKAKQVCAELNVEPRNLAG